MAHVEAQRFLCHYKGFYDFIYFLKLHQNRVVLCGDWYRCMWPLLTSLLLSQFYYRILTLVWHYTIWCLNLLKAIWSRLGLLYISVVYSIQCFSKVFVMINQNLSVSCRIIGEIHSNSYVFVTKLVSWFLVTFSGLDRNIDKTNAMNFFIFKTNLIYSRQKTVIGLLNQCKQNHGASPVHITVNCMACDYLITLRLTIKIWLIIKMH